MENKKKYRGVNWGSILLFVLIIGGILWMANKVQMHQQEISYSTFVKEVEAGNVTAADIRQNSAVPTGRVTLSLKDDSSVRSLNVSDVGKVEELLQKNDVKYSLEDVPKESIIMSAVLPSLITLCGIFLLFMLMNRQNGGTNSKAMNFGKSRARMSTQNEIKVTFADVAGLKEEKEELEEIVDFLKAPRKYTQLGARIPKGVLLEGPPEPVRRCLQRQWQEKQEFRSSAFRVLISWRCLSESVHPVSGICSRMRRRMPPVSCLLMRSMRSQDGAAAVLAVVMTRESRH